MAVSSPTTRVEGAVSVGASARSGARARRGAWLRACLVGALALSAPAAQAQDPAAAPEPGEAVDAPGDKPAYEKLSLEQLLQVPIIVTASREEEAATDAPATSVVITREEIRLRGYSFLKDVLRDLPGMETKEYYYGVGGGTQVPVRGVLGNNKIILLINGVRVNPPGGEPARLASDMSVRDADQIEIVYGPGSTLYGQDAISAVINVITRRTPQDNVSLSLAEARDRFLNPAPISQRLLNFGMEFGYPTQKEVYGSLNVRIKDARLYGSVHYLDKQLTDLGTAYPEYWSQHQAVVAGTGQALDPRRFDTGLNLMFRVEYGNASLQIFHRQSARSYAEGLGTPGVPFVAGSRYEDMSTVVEARHVQPLGRYFSLESSLTFNRFEIDPSTRVFPPLPQVEGQLPALLTNDFKYGRGISGALTERLTFRLAQRLSMVAGLFLAHYDITPMATIPDGADPNASVVEQGGVLQYYTRQADPSSLVELTRVNPIAYQDFGGYVEANWRMFKLLRLIVGLRLDKNTTVSDLAFSPRAALIFNYKSFSAKYIVARAFVAPAPADKYAIFQSTAFQSSASVHGPNTSLQPETAVSNELNVAFNNQHVSLGTSVYYNTQQDLVFQSGLPLNDVQQVWLDAEGQRPVTLQKSINAGSSRAVGVDVFGKFRAWKFSGWASYSFTDVQSDADGEEQYTQGLSAHNFRLGLSFSALTNLHFTASAIVKSVPENLDETPALSGLLATPWELNAHILYSPIPSIDLYADFRNLTDHKYYLAGNRGPYPVQAFQGSGGVRFSF
ncbi:MAG: TonB-dependent receptor [Polyangia bacterium]